MTLEIRCRGRGGGGGGGAGLVQPDSHRRQRRQRNGQRKLRKVVASVLETFGLQSLAAFHFLFVLAFRNLSCQWSDDDLVI